MPSPAYQTRRTYAVEPYVEAVRRTLPLLAIEEGWNRDLIDARVFHDERDRDRWARGYRDIHRAEPLIVTAYESLANVNGFLVPIFAALVFSTADDCVECSGRGSVDDHVCSKCLGAGVRVGGGQMSTA